MNDVVGEMSVSSAHNLDSCSDLADHRKFDSGMHRHVVITKGGITLRLRNLLITQL
jgi:hypothetical protein